MNSIRTLISLVLLAAATAGCSDNAGHGQVFRHISVLDADHIAIHARSGPDAVVSSNGDFSIDGKPVAVAPAQQALLKQYFNDAIALRDDAIATGRAGVATASKAIGSVVSGLASGNPDKIGAEVEARAAKVEASAAKVCADVTTLYSRQTAISAGVEAFRPYATIESPGTAGDCLHLERDR
ncbi:MAG: hypothetical protein ACHP7D_09200 [Lysobacterales bacterium]